MTKEQYLKSLKKLGLTVSGKATQEALGLSPRQLRRLASGDSEIPGPVEKLLELLVLLHRSK
jgi:hypothetical protein